MSSPKLPNIPHHLQQHTLDAPTTSQIKTSTDSHRPHTDKTLPSARTRRKSQSRTSKDSAVKVYRTGKIRNTKQQNKKLAAESTLHEHKDRGERSETYSS